MVPIGASDKNAICSSRTECRQTRVDCRVRVDGLPPPPSAQKKVWLLVPNPNIGIRKVQGGRRSFFKFPVILGNVYQPTLHEDLGYIRQCILGMKVELITAKGLIISVSPLIGLVIAIGKAVA